MDHILSKGTEKIPAFFFLVFIAFVRELFDRTVYHRFNIHNSAFCPHSVFMCFVWIWEQTVIISLYNINWLVFITEI